MKQDKVNEFIDKTIRSLCHNPAVDVDFIIKRLRENSKKYYEILERGESSQTKKNYLAWYIVFADQRIEELKSAKKIGFKMGKSKPVQIFEIVKLREKLSNKIV